MPGKGEMARSFRSGPDREEVFDRRILAAVVAFARDETVDRKAERGEHSLHRTEHRPARRGDTGHSNQTLGEIEGPAHYAPAIRSARNAQARSWIHPPIERHGLSAALHTRGARALVSPPPAP